MSWKATWRHPKVIAGSAGGSVHSRCASSLHEFWLISAELSSATSPEMKDVDSQSFVDILVPSNGDTSRGRLAGAIREQEGFNVAANEVCDFAGAIRHENSAVIPRRNK